MAVFWLVLAMNASNYPLHVGNFPNLNSCEKAATEMRRGSASGLKSGASMAPYSTWACVQANTGKAGDPSPPD